MTTIIAAAAKILIAVTPIIEQKYKIKVPNITIAASGKMTRVFGRASHSLDNGYKITISKYAYEGNTETKAFRNTVIHEIAHIIEHKVYKRFSHSADWASIMNVLGEKASIFVTKEKRAEIEFVRPPKRKMTKYVHKCAAGCTHVLSGQKHNKLMCGIPYHCRKSGAKLLTAFETVKA